MQLKDLRVEMPRRWNEQLGGIYWLPRLIDKANASVHGTLGDFFYGQSPMDDWFMRQLRVDYPTLAAIVRDAADEDAVLAALTERDAEGVERARRWSATLPRKQAVYLLFLDIDEGYRFTPLRSTFNALTTVLARTIKRVIPT